MVSTAVHPGVLPGTMRAAKLSSSFLLAVNSILLLSEVGHPRPKYHNATGFPADL